MAIPGSGLRKVGGDVIPTPVGEIRISIEVAPDPYDIELELMQVAGNLENISQPLLASGRVLADDVKERFETETDPDGDAWIPLDEEYLANKLSLGYPADILHRTGALEKAATSLSAYRVVDDSVFFDTSGLPDYGLLHQLGSGDEANVGLASRHRFRAATDEDHKRTEGGGHTNLGIGRGNALPARSFLGMSEEAEGKILTVFDLWFDEATSVFIGKSGTVQRREASGRFGPKIIL